ncbi:uncharacterized protein LOC127857220 [Dreissena polymorpha]|uniref:uncharacterized protein LOC127857220 n=1 Tax=Dreissena polymorpha TaxID=45954 RepID=UPI0022649365|nr:uncharacterized protein LOC127857220 [Dreissena polymorpha]
MIHQEEYSGPFRASWKTLITLITSGACPTLAPTCSRKQKICRKSIRSTGLEVNIIKTKCLRINQGSRQGIHIEGQVIEEVDHFTYLGSIFSKTGGTEEDINARIGNARHAFGTMSPVWNNRNIHWKTKIRLFNTNVKTVLLYGAEIWKRTRRLDQSLQVFINKYLGQILRIRWPEKISNQDLWARTGQKPVMNSILQKKWRWIGHMLRTTQPNIARQALDLNHQGQRRRGRSTNSWRRTLDIELRKIRMSWGEAKAREWTEPDGGLW